MSKDSKEPETPQNSSNPDLKLFTEAIQDMVKKMILEFEERMDEKNKIASQTARTPPNVQHRFPPRDEIDDDFFNELDNDHGSNIKIGYHGRQQGSMERLAEQEGGRQGPRRGRMVERKDTSCGSIKLKIPPFQGKNDPEAYLKWEKKIELVFNCYNFSDVHKVKLATTSFTDYAILWWDQLITSMRRNGERPIDSWEDMKAIMRKRHVPNRSFHKIHARIDTIEAKKVSAPVKETRRRQFGITSTMSL